MKLFSSDREPRSTPVVCGPPPTQRPTDLSLNNASSLFLPLSLPFVIIIAEISSCGNAAARVLPRPPSLASLLSWASEATATVTATGGGGGEPPLPPAKGSGDHRLRNCGRMEWMEGEKISSTSIRRDGYRRGQGMGHLPRSVPVKGAGSKFQLPSAKFNFKELMKNI